MFTGWTKNYGRAHEHNGRIPRHSPSTDDEKCFANFRLTSWEVCWSLAITERLSPMSNHSKRFNYTGEEKVAILRAHFVEGLLVQKNEVIAELLQEHVQLKKANGDP
jgi:hypothetical protein